ncbi:MAG: hypothetical protein ACRDPA_08840, partial [Solirubrobacteraceae bacterium]
MPTRAGARFADGESSHVFMGSRSPLGGDLIAVWLLTLPSLEAGRLKASSSRRQFEDRWRPKMVEEDKEIII